MVKVVKRDGSSEEASVAKLTARLKKLCTGLDAKGVDPVRIAEKTVQGLCRGTKTADIDTLAAQTAAGLVSWHPDFAILAGRIEVSKLHKETPTDYSKVIQDMRNYVHPTTHAPAPLLAKDVFDSMQANMDKIKAKIDYQRDYQYDYFAIKTLQRSYLLKMNGFFCERPQQLIMRVAFGIHKADVAKALETYDLMSNLYFIHATPTLFNAGTNKPQMSSCFLLTMKDDSIEGIFATLKDCASISKYAGGIGLSMHKIRASGSYIRGTNGASNGLVPMLRVYNATARYVDQGGGKRKGAFAIYIEPWHADIRSFLDLKKNHGKEELRARDLFYALWIPDLFMKRVMKGGKWSLFCPNECPGLPDTYGDEFEALYEKYEKAGRARDTIDAQQLWLKILESQIETGTPYMLYKDACNKKSNQKNLGTIRNSNLCTEVIQYVSPEETAVCNLASINLSKLVTADKKFDFKMLIHIAGVVTFNLNRVIDANFYPIKEAETSNKRHRPIGIGVQGLADTFAKMEIAWETPEARALNKKIFECMYYGACKMSIQLAKEHGPYSTYEGSPTSEGKFQFDLWGLKSDKLCMAKEWDELRAEMLKHGIRNSLLVAPMPTASTSQILGNNECFEPYTTNIYSRRVLAGEFVVTNKHLIRDLIAHGIWNADVRNQMIADGGSVQRIACVPAKLKAMYKTVWEIKQKALLQMCVERGPFICQSQSTNCFVAKPNQKSLTAMHFYGWKYGLKTGMYYLRTRPKADAIQFTVDQTKLKAARAKALQKENEAAANRNKAAIAATAAANKKTKVVDKYDSEAPVLPTVDAPECLSCGS